MEKKVNCTHCKHFFITWETHAPKGCRAYGIKCTQLPSIEVAKATGEYCLAYESKASLRKSEETSSRS